MSQAGKFDINGGPGGDVLTLTGNSGGPVSPDGAGNINVVGDVTTIDVVGNPATNTLTLSVSDEVATDYDTDSGVATPALNVLNILGGTGVATTGAGNTVIINTSDEVAITYTTDDANTATPAAGNLNVFGGLNSIGIRNINTTSAGSTVSINLEESIHQPVTNAIMSGAGSQGWYSLGVDGGNVPVRFMHNYGTAGTFLGSEAGNNTYTGDGGNTGIGRLSLSALTTGNRNTALGAFSLRVLTTGFQNMAIGQVSLNMLTTGSQNTAIGAFAGENLLTGNLNTMIGRGAGISYIGAESSNLLIKNSGTAGENNTIRIGTQGAGAGQQNRNFQAGIAGVSVANQNMVTIDTTTGQLGSEPMPVTIFPWTEIVATGPTAMAINNGYIANNAALVTLTLPSVAAVGSTIKVTTKGTGLVRVAQTAGVNILFGVSTSVGVGGYIESLDQYSSVELLCITANTTWIVLNNIGNWDVI